MRARAVPGTLRGSREPQRIRKKSTIERCLSAGKNIFFVHYLEAVTVLYSHRNVSAAVSILRRTRRVVHAVADAGLQRYTGVV